MLKERLIFSLLRIMEHNRYTLYIIQLKLRSERVNVIVFFRIKSLEVGLYMLYYILNFEKKPTPATTHH